MNNLKSIKKYELIILLILTLSNFVCKTQDILTNHYLVEFHEDIEPHVAHEIAKRNNFEHLRPVSVNLRLYNYHIVLHSINFDNQIK